MSRVDPIFFLAGAAECLVRVDFWVLGEELNQLLEVASAIAWSLGC